MICWEPLEIWGWNVGYADKGLYAAWGLKGPADLSGERRSSFSILIFFYFGSELKSLWWTGEVSRSLYSTSSS